MPIAVSRIGYHPSGGMRPLRGRFSHDMVITMGRITFSGTYPLSGETLPPSSVGLRNIRYIEFTTEPSAGAGVPGQMPIFRYHYDTGRLMAFKVSGADAYLREVNNGTDLSPFACRFVAFGT